MNKVRTVPLALIRDTRYSRVLNYPATDAAEVDARLRELAAIGVTALRFSGSSLIEGIDILGKGCVGLVTQAVCEGGLVALKIRRADADRPSMEEEARLLRVANSVNVGPGLISATRNFLVMEMFDGLPLFRWANGPPRRHSLVRRVLSDLLQSCFRLDAIGLDHGELSHAPRNVLVGAGGRTCIVDFETASMVRRVANVTSLLQYFLFGSISGSLQIEGWTRRRRDILRSLTKYKHGSSLESYQHVLRALRLGDYAA